MPALDKLPKPVLFGLYGTIAGLLSALTLGEILWYLLRPPAEPEIEAVEPHTEPPVPPRLAPPPLPLAQLALAASPRVAVYPGGTATVSVRIARERFDGPVLVKFVSPIAGLSAPEVTLPANATSGLAEVIAAQTVKPGTYKITALASANTEGQSLAASATIEVTVPVLPPNLPRLAVGVSPQVQVYQNGKNAFAVRIERANFDEAVTVAFGGLPDGVAIPQVAVPAGQTELKVELNAGGRAKIGTHKITVAARAEPKGIPVEAATETALEVLGSPGLPVDVVLVLDCTGSMRKAVAGIGAALPKLNDELEKARLDPRFGIVGFQDTTLGQPIKIPRINGDRMTADLDGFRAALNRLRLGGGGGEGESSLDGIAEAADCPFRESAVRVLLLVTDGGPKRSDGRMKSADETVKYLKEKKIDQLHVVALPEHRKPFEPLWAGAKGKYFDLGAANVGGDYAKLLQDLGRAVSGAIPERPENKPEASGAAPEPILPQAGTVKPPTLPPGEEPKEPKLEKPTAPLPAAAPEPPAPEPIPGEPRQKPVPARPVFAACVWLLAVGLLVCAAMLVGQMTVLPGGLPAPEAGAIGYGSGLFLGLAFAALGFFAFDAVAGAFLGRMAGGSGLGLGVGLLVPVVGSLVRREPPESDPALPGLPEVLDLPTAVPPVAPPPVEPKIAMPVPTVLPVKPVITAPTKPRDGCPGCGRQIPGEPGKRYCMLCDNTF